MIKLFNLIFESLSDEDRHKIFMKEFWKHEKFLRNYARKLTDDPEKADDLFQNTMIACFRFLDTYEPNTNSQGWIARVMKNQFINLYRKDKIDKGRHVKIDDLGWNTDIEDDSTYNNSPFQSQDHSELGDYGDELHTALLKLPESLRRTLELSVLEDYKYDEIAEIMNIPIGTVRSRINRAKEKLKALLSAKTQEKLTTFDKIGDFINSDEPEPVGKLEETFRNILKDFQKNLIS